MRLSAYLFATLVLALSGTAVAQTWTEYLNREDRFHIIFPGEPKIEEIEWISADDQPLPAHRYSAELGPNRYAITVVHYQDAEFTTMRGSIAHTATAFRHRGEVTLDEYAQLDRIGGHQLEITLPGGERELYVAIYLEDRILYVTEAEVPLGSPRATIFQHSLSIIDENGIRVRYNRDGTRNFERQLGE